MLHSNNLQNTSMQWQEIFFLRNVQTGSGNPPAFYSMGFGVHSRRVWGAILTTHLHPESTLKMGGATLLLHLYEFVAWTETTLPLQHRWLFAINKAHYLNHYKTERNHDSVYHLIRREIVWGERNAEPTTCNMICNFTTNTVSLNYTEECRMVFE